jgi:hypothetical protein
MSEKELLVKKALALPLEYVHEAIDFIDYLLCKAAESESLAVSMEQNNAAFEDKIAKARTDLANGKGVVMSMEQMKALEND